jgi:hypothetical protein
MHPGHAEDSGLARIGDQFGEGWLGGGTLVGYPTCGRTTCGDLCETFLGGDLAQDAKLNLHRLSANFANCVATICASRSVSRLPTASRRALA